MCPVKVEGGMTVIEFTKKGALFAIHNLYIQFPISESVIPQGIRD